MSLSVIKSQSAVFAYSAKVSTEIVDINKIENIETNL